MKKYYLILFIVIPFFFAACNRTPKIENFDSQKWKEDKNACSSIRETMVSSLFENKKQLIGISDKALFSLLGNPDFQNYYERGKKSYCYYFQAGKQCDNNTQLKAQYIVFEVNSLGKVVIVNRQKI
ncbi:MAG: hypothetical protein ACK4ND_11620 [Cytophagaceae bacterium]